LYKLSIIGSSVILFFVIVVFTPLFAAGIGPSNNTNTTSNTTFITYENSTRGIKIDYPKDWTPMIQYGLAFLSPKENNSDTFREGLTVAKGHHGNESISTLAATVLKFYNSSLPSFKLVESKGTTFHGNPAQSLVYTFNLPGNGTIKVLESGTTENDNIYIFRYVAQENKYDSYLPIINRMIDSFRATK
jgi:eukaryotic-like serine/threonine-protein kinase